MSTTTFTTVPTTADIAALRDEVTNLTAVATALGEAAEAAKLVNIARKDRGERRESAVRRVFDLIEAREDTLQAISHAEAAWVEAIEIREQAQVWAAGGISVVHSDVVVTDCNGNRIEVGDTVEFYSNAGAGDVVGTIFNFTRGTTPATATSIAVEVRLASGRREQVWADACERLDRRVIID